MPRDIRRIFKASVINPVAVDRVLTYAPGYLVIAGEHFERLGENDPRSKFPSAEFVDLGSRTVLPGFVDTHVHLPQFKIMGIGAGELLTWLNTYTYPEEARFADRIRRQISHHSLMPLSRMERRPPSSIHRCTSKRPMSRSVAQAKGVRASSAKS
jgi:cytosine/adenosine deaminase-related metal-dependent hydrolase